MHDVPHKTRPASKLGYFKNLDGIRAIAALMVMVFHFFPSVDSDSSLVSFITKASIFGQTGVILFFVLSGFLITRILLYTKKTAGYFKNFYIRRTLRIFPLYYLFLVLVYLIMPSVMFGEAPDWKQQVPFWTYLQNVALTFNWDTVGPIHYWSLAVEEHFYLFWPLVVLIVSRKNLGRVILGIILTTILLRVVLLSKGYPVFFFTFTQMDCLAIGAYLALLERRNFFHSENANQFLMLMAGSLIPTISMMIYLSGEGNYYLQLFKYTTLSLTFFGVIGYVLSIARSHNINRMLNTRVLSYLGKVSYGLYVYHPFVFALCKKYVLTDYIVLNLLIQFSLTFVVSALSFELFERRFLNLKKYFTYKTHVPSVEAVKSK